MWATVCCLLLLALSRWRRRRQVLIPALVLLAVHVWYVYSSTAFVVLATTAITVVGTWFLRPVRMRPAYIFAIIVLVGGLVVPFLIALHPTWQNALFQDEVLAKGGADWESKLRFVNLGTDVLYRVWPDPRYKDMTSHNLVFEAYLSYGILFLIPILWFEWRFLVTMLRSRSNVVLMATLLTLVATNHEVPAHFFFPFGAMWLLTTAAVVRFTVADTVSQLRASVMPARQRLRTGFARRPAVGAAS
jgi:hypothetical protein